MNPSTPKTELPPSTQLRKAVFGGSYNTNPARGIFIKRLATFMAAVVVGTNRAYPVAYPVA